MIRSGLLWHPEMFHGRGRRTSAFDSWYFKIVDPQERYARVIIPGVWMDRDPARQYCFIQVLDGRTGRAATCRYPFDQFWTSRERFDIICGRSRFSLSSMHLDIDSPDLRLMGDLHLSQAEGWPVRPWSPGTMGPMAFDPFLDYYHDVTGIDPRITGMLSLDGDDTCFSGGKAYMERDRGSAFPHVWAWTQSNHFDQDHVCLTAMIADMPVAGRIVRGFTVGFLLEGVLHRWTPWNGSQLAHFQRDAQHVAFTVVSGTRVLEVWSGGGNSVGLSFAPRTGVVEEVPVEQLNAVVQVRFLERHAGGDTLLFEGRGRNGGLEIGGGIPIPVRDAGSRQAAPVQRPQGL